MIVVPTQEQVTLTFGVTWVEKVGRILTVTGLLVIVAWFVWRRRQRGNHGEMAL
jgi:predicted negative regulator of RcsB-dependent stress response